MFCNHFFSFRVLVMPQKCWDTKLFTSWIWLLKAAAQTQNKSIIYYFFGCNLSAFKPPSQGITFMLLADALIKNKKNLTLHWSNTFMYVYAWSVCWESNPLFSGMFYILSFKKSQRSTFSHFTQTVYNI